MITGRQFLKTGAVVVGALTAPWKFLVRGPYAEHDSMRPLVVIGPQDQGN